MKYFIVMLGIFMAFATSGVNAGVQWTGLKTVVSVQVVETGGFLIGFDSEINPICTTASTSRLYVYPNTEGVTPDGIKSLLSVALTALSTGMSVTVMYENTDPHCYGRYILISK